MKGVGSLATAAAYGDIELVSALIDDGDDVDKKSEDGMAPLCIAAFWGYHKIVKILLKHGADINITNDGTKWSPLHCASFQGHGKCVMQLLKANAEMGALDKDGRTAIDFASASDSIWAHFAGLGCTRTSKAELLALGIIHRAKAQPVTKQEFEEAQQQGMRFSDYTRPGSAYVISSNLNGGRGRTARTNKTHNNGDVLQLFDEKMSLDQQARVPDFGRRGNAKPQHV